MRLAARIAPMALAALLGASCAAWTPPATAPSASAPRPPRAARAPSTADELVAYLARLRTLDEAGLAGEAARQREFARQTPSAVNRLKVALALAAAPQSEDADIATLIEPLTKETQGTDPDVRSVASFLQGIVVERRRLKESAAAAGNRARDDRRALEAQKQRAEQLQERNAQLQQKIDALTDLEKSLSGRKGN